MHGFNRKEACNMRANMHGKLSARIMLTIYITLLLPAGCREQTAPEEKPSTAQKVEETSSTWKELSLVLMRLPEENTYAQHYRSQINELSDALAENPADSELHYARAIAETRLSYLLPPRMQMTAQATALADLDKAIALAQKMNHSNAPEADAATSPNCQESLKAPLAASRQTSGYIKARLAAALLLLDQDRADEASERLVDVPENDEFSALAQACRVFAKASGERNWPAACESLRKLVTSCEKSNPEIFSLLGQALMAKGEFSEAETALAKAIENDPDHPKYRNKLALSLCMMGREDEAKQWLDHNIPLRDSDHDRSLHQAMLLHDEGKFTEAITLSRIVLRAYPGSPAALTVLGKAYAGAKRFDDAIAVFEHSIKLFSLNGEAHLGLGKAYRNTGRYDDAEASFFNARLYMPQVNSVLYEAGINYMQAGKWQKAVSVFTQFLSGGVDYQDSFNEAGIPKESTERAFVESWQYKYALMNMGHALVQLGKYEQAESPITLALKLDPNSAAAHYSMGVVKMHQKACDEATNHLMESLRLDPNYEESLYRLRDIALLFDRKELLPEQLNSIDPEVPARNSRDLLLLCSFSTLGKYHEVIERGTDMLHSYPDEILSSIEREIGFAHMMLGDFDQANDHIRKSYDLLENHYMAIFLWMNECELHGSQADNSILQSALDKADKNAFVSKLLEYHLDRLSQDQLFATVKSEGDRCEACYYIGEQQRLRGNRESARQWFQKALDTRVSNYIEYDLAIQRLGQMND